MTPGRQQKEEGAKLIELVKAEPCLYDSAHINYGNKKVKDAAWKLIAAKCGKTEAKCKSNFNDWRKKYIRPSTPGERHYLHEEMEFIKPFLTRDELKELNESTRSAVGNEIQLEDRVLTRENVRAETSESFASAAGNVTQLNASQETSALAVGNETKFEEPFLTRTNLRNELFESTASELGNETQLDHSLVDATRKATTKLEQSNDAQHDIINLADREFLEFILDEMQNLNSHQKRIFKEKIWESICSVRDSINRNTYTHTNYALHNTDFKTGMELITRGTALLNVCRTNDDNAVCDNSVTNSPDQKSTPFNTPVRKKQ